MTKRMLIMGIGFFVLGTSVALSSTRILAEYAPLKGRFLAVEQEIQSASVSEEERQELLSAWRDLGDKVLALRQDLGEKQRALLQAFQARVLSRQDVDLANEEFLGAWGSLARLNAEWQARNVKALGKARLWRLRAAHQSSERYGQNAGCGPWQGYACVPMLRYDLTGSQRKRLALSEDEERYLAEFQKRNLRLREEHQALVADLDAELDRASPRMERVDMLLERLGRNVRQSLTNAADCFFYAEANLFTPQRIAKLKLKKK